MSERIGWWYCEGCGFYFSIDAAEWPSFPLAHFERCREVRLELIDGNLSRCGPPPCDCFHCTAAQPRPVDLQTGPQKSPRGDHHE